MANENTVLSMEGYSTADVKITFNDLELPGITNFELNLEQSKNNNLGMGVNPVSRSRSQKEYSGSLEMDYDTKKRLLENFANTDNVLTSIPPGLLEITLARTDGGFEKISVPFMEFNGDGISGSQGDENLTKSVDIIFAGINQTTI